MQDDDVNVQQNVDNSLAVRTETAILLPITRTASYHGYLILFIKYI